MQTGFQVLQKAIEDSKKASSSGPIGGVRNYFSWKSGDRKIIRFLTNDIITADFYEWILTNDGKTKSFLIDPDKGDFVEKYASAEPGLGWRRNPKTQQLEPRKTRKLTVGMAVLRDEKPAPGDGGGTTFSDYFYEIDIKGEIYPARYFGIIQQSHGNFWDQLVGFHKRYGSICDRDYEITRTGAALDTKYQIVPLDPIEEMRDLAAVQRLYGYGAPWPSRPEDGASEAEVDRWRHRFVFCPQTLAQWAEQFSSEERVKYWLTPVSDQGSAQRVSAEHTSSGLDEFHPATSWSTPENLDEAQVSATADFRDLKRMLQEQQENRKGN